MVDRGVRGLDLAWFEPFAEVAAGVPQVALLNATGDAESGVSWLRRAAHAGLPRAMLVLVAQAAEVGDPDAMSALGSLLRRRDRGQRPGPAM